jgi:hypothetical protein
MRTMRTTTKILAIAALAGLEGCSAMGGLFGPRVRECDGFTVPLSVLAGNSRKELRVRIVGSSAGQDLPFVVESGKESLVLVAFTPLGTKSFTLERRGDEVKVENVVGGVQPIPPKNIMADVLAMSLPSACSPATDGPTPVPLDGWIVEDDCQDGRPIHRRISRPVPGKDPSKLLEVDYTGDSIFVHQRKCGYSARYVLQAVAKPVPKKKPKKTETKKPEKPAKTKPKAAAPGAAPAAPAPAAAPASPSPAAPPAPASN